MTVIFCTFLGNQVITFAILDVTIPIVGISFVLILLRLNSYKSGSVAASSHAGSQRGAKGVYPLQPITVNVSRHTDVDSDVEGKMATKGPYGDMV